MSDLHNRLIQFRKELNKSIDTAKGNCNKVALENFTDDLKELDNIIRDLANDAKKEENTLPIDIVSGSAKHDILLHWAKTLSYKSLSEHQLYKNGEWLVKHYR